MTFDYKLNEGEVTVTGTYIAEEEIAGAAFEITEIDYNGVNILPVVSADDCARIDDYFYSQIEPDL